MFSQPSLERKTSVLDDSAKRGFHPILSFKKKKKVIFLYKLCNLLLAPRKVNYFIISNIYHIF